MAGTIHARVRDGMLYEFGLIIVHRAATLQGLHRGPHVESNPCAQRCP
jgi:hypothetical protein